MMFGKSKRVKQLEKSIKDVPSACLELAESYFMGDGVKKNNKKAIKLLETAVDRANPVAAYELGNRLLEGNGTAANPKRGFELIKWAADSGYTQALCVVGRCYFEGRGVERDGQRAFAYFKKAADAGVAEAFIGLGRCYNKGVGVKENHYRGIICYKQAADMGNNEARLIIGRSFVSGFKFDFEKSYKELERLAKMLEDTDGDDDWFDWPDGGEPAQSDFEAEHTKLTAKGIALIELAANEGHIPSQMELAVLFNYGDTYVSADMDKAVYWYTKAAESGNTEAMYSLALLYTQEQLNDREKYLYWLRKSADAGHLPAVGLLINNSIFSNRFKEAKKLVKRWLPEDTTGKVYYSLATMYHLGYGVKQNKNAARKYAQKAVELGEDRAQLYLDN